MMRKPVIIPVPYEKTTSYGKGAKNGPSAIISALKYVEDYDIEENRIIDKASVKILPALKNLNTYQKLSDEIDKVTKKVLTSVGLPIYLGGEHTITTPIIAAIKKQHSDFTVLHLDAHSDLRDTYSGTKHSHACVMRRVYEMNVPIVSAGIRSQSGEESKFIADVGANGCSPLCISYAHDIHKDKNWIEKAVKNLSKNFYLSFDVDVFDPSIVRATGTPEPGGLSWQQIVDLLTAVKEAKKHLLAMDMVELAPVISDHASDFTCAKLLHKIFALFDK